MLVGLGYADCDPAEYNCDCNEDTWEGYKHLYHRFEYNFDEAN